MARFIRVANLFSDHPGQPPARLPGADDRLTRSDQNLRQSGPGRLALLLSAQDGHHRTIEGFQGCDRRIRRG